MIRLRWAICLYRLLWWPALPLALGYLWWRGRRDPDYRRHWDERLGGGPTPEGAVWVHAVSLGELRSAVPLIRALLDRGERVVTTHLTPAGRRAAHAAFPAEIAAGRLTPRYLPVETHHAWHRVLRRGRPKLVLALEIEIWPGMIAALQAAAVPLALVNSQVPEASYPRARRLARLLGHPVALVPLVLAKSDRHAARFTALGAPHVVACGELRFDQPVPAAQTAAAHALRPSLGDRPVVTLASVVAGEEAIYLEALARLPVRPLVVWVPRAAERFDATADRLAAAGLRVARRSTALDGALDSGPAVGPALNDVDVLLGDSFGEMFFYLALGDVAVVGGGFVPKGAHNIIEPLALGRPVLVGPHVWTIEYPGQEAMAAGVVTLCPDPPALATALAERLAAPGDGRAMAAFLAAHGGATARTLEALAPLLEGRDRR
ncbi:MAG: 3-deoxy-D-manno-octulosonic acid transferase [Alkalilacustris sp.]